LKTKVWDREIISLYLIIENSKQHHFISIISKWRNPNQNSKISILSYITHTLSLANAPTLIFSMYWLIYLLLFLQINKFALFKTKPKFFLLNLWVNEFGYESLIQLKCSLTPISLFTHFSIRKIIQPIL
jgi:hypothetical protein